MSGGLIVNRLVALRDEGYRAFNSKLIPTVAPERVIGIRVPHLRQLARDLNRDEPEACQVFMAALPHRYHEEDNLHGFLIELEKDFDRAMAMTESFLPHVDNWATCDLFSPKVFKKRPEEALAAARRWIDSAHPYTRRYGIGLLLGNYLNEHFRPELLDWVADVRDEHYYVRMMVAWYFATALGKQYEAALPYIEGRRLDPWTHNKAIQKAIESRVISEERKAHLRTLRLKAR